MTDSLIAGGYELIGGGTNPEYRLAPDWDFGEGAPDTATISSQFLDGDTVVGDRTANRDVKLPVMLYAASRTDLTAKIDVLRQAVSAGPWVLQWTPDGGLPMLLDCYRAKVTRKRDCIRDASFSADIEITCPALPFGRSLNQQTITVTTRVQVDSYDTAPTGATLRTNNKIEGTGSADVTLTKVSAGVYQNSTPVSRSFAAKDLSAQLNLVLQGLMSHLYYGHLSGVVTLVSAAGSSKFTLSTVSGDDTWHVMAALLSGGVVVSGSGVNLAAVTSYQLTLTATTDPGVSSSTITVTVDDLAGTGSSAVLTATTRGELMLVPNVVGSARTPVSLAAVGTINSLLAHRPPADQDANLQILTGVTVAASPSHPAAATIAAVNAHFGGTYSAVLGVSTVGAAGSNTVTVTITQLANAVSVASQVLTAVYTSPQADRLVKLGEVTLPLRAVPVDNTTTTYTIDVNHTAGADQYSDVMLLDTRGQTVVADPASAVGAIYLDSPAMPTTLGQVYASATGARTDAYGILDTALVSGGPFVFEPGNNRMLVWADATTPALTTTYYPRWLDERVV